jgi:hypothetical protein
LHPAEKNHLPSLEPCLCCRSEAQPENEAESYQYQTEDVCLSFQAFVNVCGICKSKKNRKIYLRKKSANFEDI